MAASDQTFKIQLTKVKKNIETEEIEYTWDDIKELVLESWKEHVYGGSKTHLIQEPDMEFEPVGYIEIPFQFNDETRFIQYDKKYSYVHLFEPLRMVLGDQKAIEWLVCGFFGYGPTQDLWCLDGKINEISQYDQYTDSSKYTEFKKKYGSIQQYITDYCETAEDAFAKVKEDVVKELVPKLKDFKQKHKTASVMYKRALYLHFLDVVKELFNEDADDNPKRQKI